MLLACLSLIWVVASGFSQEKWKSALVLWDETSRNACQALPFINLGVARFEAKDRPGAEQSLVRAALMDPARVSTFEYLAFAVLLDGDCTAPLSPTRALSAVGLRDRAPLASPAASLVMEVSRAQPSPSHVRESWSRLEACDPARAERLRPLLALSEGRALDKGGAGPP